MGARGREMSPLGIPDPPPGSIPARAGDRTRMGLGVWRLFLGLFCYVLSCFCAVSLTCSLVCYGFSVTRVLFFVFVSVSLGPVAHSAFVFVFRSRDFLRSPLLVSVSAGVHWTVLFFSHYFSELLVPLFPGL